MLYLCLLMFPVPKTSVQNSTWKVRFVPIPPFSVQFSGCLAPPLFSDLCSVLEQRWLFLCNGTRLYLIANLGPAVTSIHFHCISPRCGKMTGGNIRGKGEVIFAA